MALHWRIMDRDNWSRPCPLVLGLELAASTGNWELQWLGRDCRMSLSVPAAVFPQVLHLNCTVQATILEPVVSQMWLTGGLDQLHSGAPDHGSRARIHPEVEVQHGKSHIPPDPVHVAAPVAVTGV